MINEALTIGKVKNIIIMLLHAITKDNISMVDHFLDDNLTAKIDQVIGNNIKNNVKQKFDLLNISHVSKLSEDNGKAVFSAKIRFCDYKVNRKTNKVVSGDSNSTVTHDVILSFKHNNVEQRAVYNCPYCGAGISINTTSICSYCKKPVDERYSEYVLTNITYWYSRITWNKNLNNKGASYESKRFGFISNRHW